MLHETIRNDNFKLNTALQHCCGIVLNGYNIVPTLRRCVALKIVIVNRPVLHQITFSITRFYILFEQTINIIESFTFSPG